MRHTITLSLLSFFALAGCAGSAPTGFCDARRSADPLDSCYCAMPRREVRPHDGGPPQYQAETYEEPGRESLYSPEAVEPSRGSGTHGPVVIH